MNTMNDVMYAEYYAWQDHYACETRRLMRAEVDEFYAMSALHDEALVMNAEYGQKRPCQAPQFRRQSNVFCECE